MIESYPLHWPDNQVRIPLSSRQNSRFDITLGRARDHLLEEVERLGGTRLIISTNMATRADGQLRASAAEPEDGAAAVYFNYKGKPMCFACDKYFYVVENVRAIGKTIEAIRGIERWGASDMMERAFRGFVALPQARSWREILGLNGRSISEADIAAKFKKLAMEHHPDHGGDTDQFRLIVQAREEGLQLIREVTA